MTSRQRLIAVAATAAAVFCAGFFVFGGTASDATGQESPATAGAQQASVKVDPIKPRNPTGQTADEAIAAHQNATEGPEQPIPFNHRFHSQELLMQCEYCHGGTDQSAIAVVPAVDLCMGCHRIVGANLEPIQRLRGYYDSGEPVPWERVYKVPDFVHFPHRAHIRSQVQCEECHGPVEEMDRVYQYSSLKMGWCLDCHWGPGEDTDVATDRLLTEQYPAPPTPDGRQPVGLYPRRLDEQYGANRAPIDCFACHH
jgi:hypothetical protein